MEARPASESSRIRPILTPLIARKVSAELVPTIHVAEDHIHYTLTSRYISDNRTVFAFPSYCMIILHTN